jgi:hypothetical protein
MSCQNREKFTHPIYRGEALVGHLIYGPFIGVIYIAYVISVGKVQR